MKCKICGIETGKIGTHIKRHNITPKAYYDKFLKKENEDICPVCGKPNNFMSLSKGYTHHCSLECKGKDPKVKQKVENTCLNKYGSTNVYASEYGRQKVKETLLYKYGKDNPQKVDSIKEKTKSTNLKKRGYTSFCNPKKAKQTCLAKYNVDNPAKAKSIQDKIRETTIERYGVRCQFIQVFKI